MNFKEILQDRQRTSETASFLLFSTRYSDKSSVHYVFCESTDDIRFYDPMLQREFGEFRFNFIPCNGKEGVYKTRRRLSGANYDHGRISYIVDADHDRFLQWSGDWGGDVFVSDYYSVESYLVDCAIFVKIFCQHAGVQKDDPVIDEIRKYFAWTLEKFKFRIVRAMAVTIVMRRKFGSGHIYLDAYDIHRYFRFSYHDGVSVIDPLENTLLNLIDDDKKAEIEGLSAQMESKLLSRDLRIWIRGKYLAWWFVQAFNALVREMNGRLDQNGVSIRCGLTMSPRQFISTLVLHSDVPARLRLFFMRRVG